MRRITKLSVALASALAVQAQMPHAGGVTKMEFERLMKELSNWGRWGKDDQLGAINLITPEKRKAAAAQVREGYSVSLARDLDTEPAVDNPTPFSTKMSPPVDGQFNMDEYRIFSMASPILTSTRFRTYFMKERCTTVFRRQRSNPAGHRSWR